MTLISCEKAVKYFEEKLSFTTGPIELHDMMRHDENIKIIDVRDSEDFAKGHIPGAINMPRGTWEACSNLSKCHVNIIYCYSEVCHLAAAAAKEFAACGFSVMELEGGFDEWQKFSLPVEKQ